MSLHNSPNPESPRQTENDEMKRTIHDPQTASPGSSSTSSASTTIQRAQSKHLNLQDTCLSTDEYWKEKAGNLQNPFAEGDYADVQIQQQMTALPDLGNEGLKDPPKPRAMALILSMARTSNIPAIKLQIPPLNANKNTNANNSKIVHHPPLSGNTISHILQHTKPDCPKAQAWITAQKISEETKLRLAQRLGNLDENEHRRLERIIATKLVEKARQMQTQGGLISMQKQEQDQSKVDWEEGNLTPQQRVRRAHMRLQRALRLE